jgi:hypothetical protein
MIVEAWLDSANTPVGYPIVNVRDIESGKVRATWEVASQPSMIKWSSASMAGRRRHQSL